MAACGLMLSALLLAGSSYGDVKGPAGRTSCAGDSATSGDLAGSPQGVYPRQLQGGPGADYPAGIFQRALVAPPHSPQAQPRPRLSVGASPVVGVTAVVMVILAFILARRRANGRALRRIVCVGDSITKGYHASSPQEAYPAQLQRLLGPGYLVENCGHCGASLLTERPGKMLYRETEEFKRSLALSPDVVVIMLGTNDALESTWPGHSAEFARAYTELISIYKELPSRPQVFVGQPPPLYKDLAYDGMLQTVINGEFLQLIPRIAEANGLPPPIPVFEAFRSRWPDLQSGVCDWISGEGWPMPNDPNAHDDGCHPNDEGYSGIARTVRAALAGRSGSPGAGPTAAEGAAANPEGPCTGPTGDSQDSGKAPVSASEAAVLLGSHRLSRSPKGHQP